MTEIVQAIPEDASPPLYMSPPPPDAVGSYGQDAIEWIEHQFGITLRWWQRLAIIRELECREDGTLCCEVLVESAPRRAGKSVRMRGTNVWRMADPLGLFSEVQLVMHTGSDMAICREIQRGAWRWAEERGWEVTRANGKEQIETPDGSRWLVRSQDGVYGYDVTKGAIDEAWNVKPETVTEGVEPATLERDQPQIHLTSTAHRRATSLMRGRIATALAVDDPAVVLLLWGARPGSDPSSEAVWRAASPHWSEARRKLIARKYEAALAGQADPEADDPDPLAGFASQYLNVWRLNEKRVDKGEPVTDEDTWGALEVEPIEGKIVGAAIESWFAHGVSLAVARLAGERVVVSVTDHRTMAEAADTLRALGYRGRLTVGASLAEDPAFRGWRVKAGSGQTGAAVASMTGLLRDGLVLHDGGEHLTEQVLAVRTLPGANGPRLASKGRADAVKAAVWAVLDARPATAKKGGRGVIMPD